MKALEQLTKAQKIITSTGPMDVSVGQSHAPECKTGSHTSQEKHYAKKYFQWNAPCETRVLAFCLLKEAAL